MSGMNMGGGMMGMDVNDIEYDAYLANDRTLNDPASVAGGEGWAGPPAHHQWRNRDRLHH